MSMSVQWTTRNEVAVDYWDAERIIEGFHPDTGEAEPSLIFEDAGNCAAFIVAGDPDNIRRLLFDALNKVPGSAKVLTIQHTCGADVGVYPSEEEALEALDYWVNRWFEYELPGVEKPADRAAAVDLYFGKVDREWYTITDAVFGQIRTQTEGPA